VNHHHRKILHALFEHPVSANIAFKDVERLLDDLGAIVEARSGGRTAIKLNGHTVFLHTAHHSISKDEVVSVRHFLKECGIDPAQYPVHPS
jgi:hypothetical protein